MKVHRVNVRQLEVGVPVEELAGDEHTKLPSNGDPEIGAQPLQEMIRPRTVQHMKLMRFVGELEELAVVAAQRHDSAEVRPGTVVVEAWTGGDSLSGVGGLRRHIRPFGRN